MWQAHIGQVGQRLFVEQLAEFSPSSLLFVCHRLFRFQKADEHREERLKMTFVFAC